MANEERSGHTVEESLGYFLARFQPPDAGNQVMAVIRALGYLDDVDEDQLLPVDKSEIARLLAAPPAGGPEIRRLAHDRRHATAGSERRKMRLPPGPRAAAETACRQDTSPASPIAARSRGKSIGVFELALP